MEVIGKVLDKKTISAKFNTQSELYWTFKDDSDISALENYQAGDEIKLEVFRDEDLIFVHDGKRIELLRDFNYVDPEIQNETIFKTFECPSCGVPLPLNNTEIIESGEHNHSIICEYCESKIPITEEMKEMILQNKEVEEKHAELFNHLRKHFKKPLKDSIFKFLNMIPYGLFTIQVLLIIIIAFFHNTRSFFMDEFMYEWLFENYNFALFLSLPSFIISCVIIFITNKNSFSDIDMLFSFFRPKANEDQQYFCRNCGNPIKSTKIPEFIICPYCQTHNVVAVPSQKFKNISDKLHIKLDEVQRLGALYNKKVKSYTWGLFIGFIVFNASFTAYTFTFEHIDEMIWISKYLALPFIVFMTLHLFNSFAQVSYYPYDSAIPDAYKKKKEDTEGSEDSDKTSFYIAAFGYSKLILGLLFFIAMFFVHKI